jgi:hypothetical protein
MGVKLAARPTKADVARLALAYVLNASRKAKAYGCNDPITPIRGDGAFLRSPMRTYVPTNPDRKITGHRTTSLSYRSFRTDQFVDVTCDSYLPWYSCVVAGHVCPP